MLAGAGVVGASSGGAISGVVGDATGTPIAGALVLYRSVQTAVRTANGGPVFSGPRIGSVVKTASDGSFSVSELPPATYHLCAYGVKATDLGSCEWGQGTTRVDLASGQTVQLKFVVAEGTMLTFQVEDPNHRIRSLEDLPVIAGRLPLTGANFAIGVWAGTRYARAALVSTNGTTRSYQIAVPKTATVRLHLDTSLNVLDATNASLLLRGPSATLAAAGQAEVIINLTVP